MKLPEKSLRQQIISFVITTALIVLAVYRLRRITLINWALIVIAALELIGIVITLIRRNSTGTSE